MTKEEKERELVEQRTAELLDDTVGLDVPYASNVMYGDEAPVLSIFGEDSRNALTEQQRFG